MISFISNFKLKITIIILIIIFILVGQFNRILAIYGNVKYEHVNVNLEGAKILQHKENGLTGKWPPNPQAIWVGTSRTNADYSPNILKEHLKRICSTKDFNFYNLGNIAFYMPYFEKLMEKKVSNNDLKDLKIIFFELSPHQILKMNMFEQLQDGVSLSTDNSYKSFRNFIFKFELYVSGFLKEFLGFTDSLNLDGNIFKKIMMYRSKNGLTAKELYYVLRAQQQYAQRFQTDGQAHYRSFIPDNEGARIVQKTLPEDPENYYLTLSNPIDHNKEVSLFSVLKKLSKNFEVIVIRPRVAKYLYDLENQKMGNKTLEQINWLKKNNITYIDLNQTSPGEYYSFTDHTHLDGFESSRFNTNIVWPAVKNFLIKNFCN